MCLKLFPSFSQSPSRPPDIFLVPETGQFSLRVFRRIHTLPPFKALLFRARRSGTRMRSVDVRRAFRVLSLSSVHSTCRRQGSIPKCDSIAACSSRGRFVCLSCYEAETIPQLRAFLVSWFQLPKGNANTGFPWKRYCWKETTFILTFKST